MEVPNFDPLRDPTFDPWQELLAFDRAADDGWPAIDEDRNTSLIDLLDRLWDEVKRQRENGEGPTAG